MIDKLQGLYVAAFYGPHDEKPNAYLRLVRHLKEGRYLARELNFADKNAERELQVIDLLRYDCFSIYETQGDMLNDWREKYRQ